MQQEGERLLNAIPDGSLSIALERTGEQWSTEQLAGHFKDWMLDGRNIAFLIGGPEGFAPSVLSEVQRKWSLSRLTFPHPLVRVILAEQIYRALSIVQNHPYHK